MSYDANFDDPRQSGGQVASGKGWIDFTRWVAGLQSPLAELKQLCEQGVCHNLPVLAAHLAVALRTGAPSSIAATGRGLQAMVATGIRDGAKSLTIAS